MRRRAKPGGEVAGGDGKADRKGPRGAKVAACFESSARELGRTANSIQKGLTLLLDERFAAAEWPRDEKEWCHSDLKNVAYYYVSKLYEDLLKGEN